MMFFLFTICIASCTGINFLLWLLLFSIRNDRDRYKDTACKYYNKCKHLERLIHELERNFHFSYIHGSTNIWSTNSTQSNEIIKDALKIAIKHSHPDNGGSSEDFIRFKNALDNMN